MDNQYIIVALIVLAALGYSAAVIWRRAGSFSNKPGCEADCGCSDSKKVDTPN